MRPPLKKRDSLKPSWGSEQSGRVRAIRPRETRPYRFYTLSFPLHNVITVTRCDYLCTLSFPFHIVILSEAKNLKAMADNGHTQQILRFAQNDKRGYQNDSGRCRMTPGVSRSMTPGAQGST